MCYLLLDLLEKSRVVFQAPGERNFHACIFIQKTKTSIIYSLFTHIYFFLKVYHLLAGADADMKQKLRLLDAQSYHYTNQGNAATIQGVDDAKEFRDVCVKKK